MMNIYVSNEKSHELVFIDTEFDEQRLVQVAMIYYTKVKDCGDVTLYTIKGSCNIYIHNKISYFFTNYTGITPNFLEKYGVEEEEAIKLLNKFVSEFCECTLLIAHGAKQDLMLLRNLGIALKNHNVYCTYNQGKRILKRDNKMKLTDLCLESGNYITSCHDAFIDCKNLINVFQYLKELESKHS